MEVTALAAINRQGLSAEAVAERRKQYGSNVLPTKPARTWLGILLEELSNILILLLLGAVLFTFYLGEYRDGIVILFIVLFNAAMGVYQEWKSENILASLKSLITESCRVRRDGVVIEVFNNELVPGDIVLLEEGDGVPADLYILSASSLAANEFILTGESVVSEKQAGLIYPADIPLTDKHAHLFMGTTIARGQAEAVVVATGKETEIGKIAQHSNTIIQTPSPLQLELTHLSKRVLYITLFLALGFVFLRLLQNESLDAAIIFAIGVAVAMVPQGLPAQIAIALSVGVNELSKKRTVVKKLAAVETLGAASVIASDKTGTITHNEMTIIECRLGGEQVFVTGNGYAPNGGFYGLDGEPISLSNPFLFQMGYLASTGKVCPPDLTHPNWYSIGDPTESAFATLALKTGVSLTDLDSAHPILVHYAFDSYRKRTSLIRISDNKPIVYCKGAMEAILPICDYYIDGNVIFEFKAEQKVHQYELTEKLAGEGLRIIAIAWKEVTGAVENMDQAAAESNLIYAGFVCMHDPPHEEVIDAMKIAFEAHMKIVIITGDSPITATAIGRHIGLFDDVHPPVVIEHTRLKQIDDEEIKRIVRVNRAVIFSRVSPLDKLRIVRAIKSDGHVVAVTGDGVNDTLSLKEADIGVAMGARGSKVAQEAADFVLLDDNFSTIIDSVRKGRQIYTNIQNNIFSVLTANFAELTCVLLGLGGTFGHAPLAIITIHILLIDCITEMLPLLALVYDPEAPGSMQQPPRNIHDHILKTKNLLRIALSGFFSGGVSFACFLLSWWETNDPVLSQTVTFISISLCMLVAVLSFRTKGTIFSSYSFSNPILTLCLGISILALIVICYVPICNVWFHTQGPGITQWYYILAAVMAKIAWHEGWKYFFMRNKGEN